MEALPSGLSREVLVGAILAFLADQDLLTLREIRAGLEQEIDTAGESALLALQSRLVADYGWDYYSSDPLARRIHHLLANRFLAPGSDVRDAHHLLLVGDVPVVIVANHLSYADANVIEVLLHRAGSEMANRLTALAGPKIFTSRQRRFSSLCFGTVKVPQSAEVASEEAVLNAREVAQAARQAITAAHERLREGDALLLFGEGTRSRSGGMQPMLAGAARYLEVPGTWVLPAGLTGSESLFPVEGSLRPARAAVQLGRPFSADALRAQTQGDRRIAMDVLGLAVAETLSPEYRGAYSSTESFPDAWNVLRAVRDAA
jgi:1-acyl-sn-glycerol-3-phosphate acyltransferase